VVGANVLRPWLARAAGTTVRSSAWRWWNSHPLAYQMEEFLYHLRDHILGLNLGRWTTWRA